MLWLAPVACYGVTARPDTRRSLHNNALSCPAVYAVGQSSSQACFILLRTCCAGSSRCSKPLGRCNLTVPVIRQRPIRRMTAGTPSPRSLPALVPWRQRKIESTQGFRSTLEKRVQNEPIHGLNWPRQASCARAPQSCSALLYCTSFCQL